MLTWPNSQPSQLKSSQKSKIFFYSGTEGTEGGWCSRGGAEVAEARLLFDFTTEARRHGGQFVGLRHSIYPLLYSSFIENLIIEGVLQFERASVSPCLRVSVV